MITQISTTINTDVAQKPVSTQRLITCNNQTELLQTFASLINIDKFSVQAYNDKSGKKLDIPVKYVSHHLNELNQYNKHFNIGFRRNQAQNKSDASAWYAFLIEYDDLDKELQIPLVEKICRENNLPYPTIYVDTGGKSKHIYWTLLEPIDLEKGAELQARFLQLFAGSDERFASVIQASRLPGFKHLKTGNVSQLYIWTSEKYSYEQLDNALPKLEIQDSIFNHKVNSYQEPSTVTSKSKAPNKGFKTPRIKTSKANNTKLDNITNDYFYAINNYEFNTFNSENIETRIGAAVDAIQNCLDGTINKTVYNESLKIGSIILKGLNIEVALARLNAAVTNRLSKSSDKNLSKALNDVIDGLHNGFYNVLHGQEHVEKTIYKFTPDVVVNQQYLQNDVLEYLEASRIVGIKSAIGTGKTQLIKRYIEILLQVKHDARIAIFLHRKSLIEAYDNELSQFKFTRYDDSISAGMMAPSWNDRFITTVDSMHKLITRSGVNPYDLVIFDECDQLFEHLTMGDTDIKNHRQPALEVLQYIVSTSKNIICASATLSNIELEFISTLNQNRTDEIKKILNIHNPNKKEYIKYASKGTILRELFYQISQDKKIAIACNSRSEATAIHKKLLKQFPDKDIKLITSHSVDEQHNLVQSLINKDKPLEVQQIIYSPTLGTGFDISREYFDYVFAIFTRNNSLSAADLLQMCGRVRNIKYNQVHVFVERGTINQERDKNIIRNQLIDKCPTPHKLDPLTGQYIPYDKNLNDGFINYVADATVRKNISLQNLHFNFWSLVRANGHDITFNAHKDDECKIVADEIQEIKKQVKQEEINQTLGAKQINSIEVDALSKKSRYSKLDKDEQAQMNKYYFSYNTGFTEVTQENLNWYERDKGKQACKNIELQLMPMEVAEMKDYMEQHMSGAKTQVDFKSHVKRKLLLEQLLELIKDATGGIVGRKKIHKKYFDEQSLSTDFLPFVVGSFDEIKNYLGFTPDVQKPVKIASTILELVGLSIKGKMIRNKNNERIRIYTITEESNRRRQNIIENIQDTRLKQWRDWTHSLLFNERLVRFSHISEVADLFTQAKKYLGILETQPVTVAA